MVVVWALTLVIALTSFALHSHAPDEVGGPGCAICLAQNVTGAATIAVAMTLAAPALKWRLQLWRACALNPFVAPLMRREPARGPPVEVFLLTQKLPRKHFKNESSK